VNFRPQFAYPTPEGYEDLEFTQYFDATTIAALGQALAAGQEARGIPLPLDQELEYHIRGIEVSSSADDPQAVRFRDPWGRYLADDYVPAGAYCGGQGSQPGGIPVVFEGEIVCPPGGIVTVDLKNLS
jgi:hypothetical protein